MRIPHVHKLQLDPSEVRSEETVKVDIRPQEYIDDIGLFESDSKEYARWIMRTKSMIRHTWEYEEMMNFLKRKRGLSACGIHPNLNVWDGHHINIHHTPFTITDIITIVTKRRMDCNLDLKQSSIIREVMELHYLGVVGLYPLCEGLCHSLAHAEDNELFIPLDCTFGQPDMFVEMYRQYMTETMLTKWENIVTLNKGYTMIRQNLPLTLQKKYIYIKNESGKDPTEHISTTKLKDFIIELNSK